MTEGKRTGEHEERIERIVRDVLGRLGGTKRSSEEGTTNGSDNADRKRNVERQSACRVLTERVITASALDGELAGVGEVHVDSGAVVTPAAQDVLRQAAVRLIRGGKDDSSTRPPTCRLVVGVAMCAMEPAAALRLADVHPGSIQQIARVGLVDVVRELAEQVVLGGSKALLFTDKPAAAVCLANRTRGVRAVAARRVDDVEMDAASVGANLLVIRPAGRSTWEQLQMTKAFLASRAACPKDLDAALS